MTSHLNNLSLNTRTNNLGIPRQTHSVDITSKRQRRLQQLFTANCSPT